MPATERAGGQARPAWIARTSPRYWTCLGVLAAAAVALQVVPGWLGAQFRKEAVPLRRSLAAFDPARLGPRYVRHADSDRLPPLDDDTLDSLGTREYLQLIVADTQAAPGDPARVAQVFVTYYTGKPDLVPHVPEECYLASGFERAGSASVSLRVPGVGAPGDELPVRVMLFEAARGTTVIPVLYFFHTNGDYATTRDEVRWKLSNPFQRYAYYAKIEVTFPQTFGLPAAEAEARSVAALPPLLERVMAVLLADHFDLEKFTEARAPQAGPGAEGG